MDVGCSAIKQFTTMLPVWPMFLTKHWPDNEKSIESNRKLWPMYVFPKIIDYIPTKFFGCLGHNHILCSEAKHDAFLVQECEKNND